MAIDMEISDIKQKVHSILEPRSEILFAYLHGSVFSSQKPNDIDVAVFLVPEAYERLQASGTVNLEYAIPLEMELETSIGMPVDLQVLNNAPLRFQYSAGSKGEVIVDRDSGIRADFEGLTRVQYFDFRPKREAYLKEAFSL